MVQERTAGYRVRGLDYATAPGGVITGIDHEAKFGASLSYQATATLANGTSSTSASVAITLPVPAVTTNNTWLKSLARPSTSVAVRSWRDGSNDLAFPRDIQQGVIRVMNRPDPIVVEDVRQLPTGTHQVWTKGDTLATALDALLRTPGPYLLQMPTVGEPDRYVMVGTVTPRSLNPFAAATDRVRVWSLPLTEVVRPPTPGWSVAVPGHTYADSTTRFPLYSNR